MAMESAGLETLCDRRQKLYEKFFHLIENNKDHKHRESLPEVFGAKYDFRVKKTNFRVARECKIFQTETARSKNAFFLFSSPSQVVILVILIGYVVFIIASRAIL